MPAEILARCLEHPELVEGRDWRRRRFRAGEHIIRVGEPGTTLYLLTSGRVRVVGEVKTGKGTDIHPGFLELETGEVFGELALFDGEVRSASVDAIEPCEVIEVDSAAVNRFLDAHPEHGYALMREFSQVLVARLRKTTRQAFSLFAWGLKVHEIDKHL